MKEDVKQILITIWQKKPTIYLGYGKGYREMTVDDVAKQIDQLFEAKIDELASEVARLCQEKSALLVRIHEPKPDEGGLLTDELEKVIDEQMKSVYFIGQNCIGFPPEVKERVKQKILEAAKAQRDLTIKEKDAEFKELCTNCDSWLWKSGEAQKLVDKCEAECQKLIAEIFGELGLALIVKEFGGITYCAMTPDRLQSLRETYIKREFKI